MAPALAAILGKIEAINIDTVDQLPFEEQLKLAKSLSKALSRAKERVAELRVIRSAFEPVWINTVRAWGQRPGCPLPRWWRRIDREISFGRDAYHSIGASIPLEMEIHIGEFEFGPSSSR
jgi:hypothetical protein